MSLFEMKLPDVGEGVAEAELVEWLVAVGDRVTPDTVIAEVLTDKATVEVSAPVAGEVAELHGEPGDVLAVGGALIGIQTDRSADPADEDRQPAPDETPDLTEADAAADPVGPDALDRATTDVDVPGPSVSDRATSFGKTASTPDRKVGSASGREPASSSAGRVTAAPAVRKRAADLDLDLGSIRASGPHGRVLHADLDRELFGHAGGRRRRSGPPRTTASDEGRSEQVRGVRRQIANRLSAAWSEIPHITYVDDVDVTELERLRSTLNERSDPDDVRLTILPFLVRAMVVALTDQPALNAHYDHASETLTTFDAVHVGIATQTDDGLRVPVVAHAEARTLRDLAAEVGRVTVAARDGSATRQELSGSTITITSLGAMGGLATTPIINAPELAIVGVNKIETRPAWRDGAFQPRQMLNLSSSFDHRMVDGWDAATFIQRIKQLVETPALLFAPDG